MPTTFTPVEPYSNEEPRVSNTTDISEGQNWHRSSSNTPRISLRKNQHLKPLSCRHRYSYTTENQGITKMSHTEASLQWGLQHKCNMFRVVYFYDPWVEEVWRRRRLTRWSLLLHIKKGERITLKSVDHLLDPRTHFRFENMCSGRKWDCTYAYVYMYT